MVEREGKVAVVTGAGSGIGAALTAKCVERGMAVVLADLHDESLAETAGPLVDAGARVLTVPTDVSDEESVMALRDAAFERFGTVHLVCNNAGVAAGLANSWSIPASEWRWAVGVNLLGVVHGINAFVPRLVDQEEGYVLNTASAAGLRAGSAVSAYSATKHAVVALSESLASDLATIGSPVGVSVLCPEYVSTRIHESERHRPAGVTAPSGEHTEMLRTGFASIIRGGSAPEDVATAAFEAMDERRFYVVTHPDLTMPAVQARFEAILHGRSAPVRPLPGS